MKNEAKKAAHTLGIIDANIKRIRGAQFLQKGDKPALVDVNAPRALIQSNGEGKIEALNWVKRQAVFSAAPDLLEAARPFVCEDRIVEETVMGYVILRMNPLELAALRAAIQKATGQEGK